MSVPSTIDAIRDVLPDYARDLKLNLGSVLTTGGAPGLNDKQIWSIWRRQAAAATRAHACRIEGVTSACSYMPDHISSAASSTAH